MKGQLELAKVYNCPYMNRLGVPAPGRFLLKDYESENTSPIVNWIGSVP